MTIKRSVCCPEGFKQCDFLDYFNNTDKTMNIQCFLLSFYDIIFENTSEKNKI